MSFLSFFSLTSRSTTLSHRMPLGGIKATRAFALGEDDMFYSSLCVVMYLRLESFRLTVVGRRKPAMTNLVTYCSSVLV